jgi:hypothetical protein
MESWIMAFEENSPVPTPEKPAEGGLAVLWKTIAFLIVLPTAVVLAIKWLLEV